MAQVRLSPRTLPFSCRCLCQHNNSVAIHVRSYNVSYLSKRPRQPPESTPLSPYYAPRKLGQTSRLLTYYDEIVAPDYLLLSYNPAAKRKTPRLPLRWDGTSPYHKNRPLPREQRPAKLHQPITTKNLPKITQITVHTMVKTAISQRPHLLSAAVAVQSITGQRPEFVYSHSSVAVFKLRPRMSFARRELTFRDSNCSQNDLERPCNV